MKTIKHLLITIAMLLCSATANAHDFEVDGIFYNIISASDLTIEVTYKGDSFDEISNEYSGEVIIPETIAYKSRILKVISIGKEAFYDCSGITSIEIPNSVTTIENYAFSGCSGITSVTIPNSVTTIKDGAFDNCTSLKELCIEDGIEILNLGYNDYDKEGLFYDCPLETLYLGRNLSYAEERDYGYTTYYPFYEKERLASVTIGNNVTNIGYKAFCGCSGITSIEFPKSVTTIGEYAFNRTGLTSVTIPNSITTIKDGAFDNCTSLKELCIEDGTSTLRLGFSEITNKNGRYELAGLFSDSPLVKLYIGRNLYSSYSLFDYNEEIISVTIGHCVTSIMKFQNCSELTSIHLLCKTPPTVDNYSFTNEQYLNTQIHVPIGTLETYQTADIWKGFWNIREEGTTETPEEDVKKCAIPVIIYNNSGFDITSETDGAEIHTKITCSDVGSYNDGRIDLSATYSITAYATKEGYLNSKTATATLCWIAVNGDSEDNSIIKVEAMPVLISCSNGTINISGGKEGAEVVVYTTSGVAVGNATITNGNATISTGLAKGEIAVISIAGKGIKIVMQ